MSHPFLVLPTPGATSAIQRHSTGGINTSVGKQIDAKAILPLPLQRSTLGWHVNSGRKRMAIGNVAELYECVFILTLVLFLKFT